MTEVIRAIRNAPATMRNLETIIDKSIACSLLGAHKACEYLRTGVVPHSHERKGPNGGYYVLRSHECPTCSCTCSCHYKDDAK